VIAGLGTGSDEGAPSIPGVRPPQPSEELIGVQAAESSPWPFAGRPPRGDDERRFDLAVRELELERREAALAKITRAIALTPVPASYFDSGQNAQEDDWWAKQLGSA
jgi:hypothetical protein